MRLRRYVLDRPSTVVVRTPEPCDTDGVILKRETVARDDGPTITRGTYCHRGRVYAFATEAADPIVGIEKAVRLGDAAFGVLIALIVLGCVGLFTLFMAAMFWVAR